MNRFYINHIISFVVYILLQVILFRNIALFDTAFCFVYVAIILLLPVETGRITTMMVALAVGLLLDVFYNSMGIHASALILIAFLRHYWIGIITPQGGFDGNVSPTASEMGGQWFATYALPLIFVHHFALFFTETGGFHMFGYTLLKVIMSSVFTFTVIFIGQLLFSKKKRAI